VSGLKIIQTQDGSHSLLNESLNETYHSTHGAIQESLHVFINNGLRHWVKKNPGQPISILEVGFGTGLNALLTLQESLEQKIKICYTTIETFPVPFEVVDQLNYAQILSNQLTEKYFKDLHATEWDKAVKISPDFTLEKRQGKIQDLNFKDENFDLVFFDAFAPNKQPEMWERPILEKIFGTLKGGSLFVTYCAKGQVKRDLRAVGFSVETLPGPPGKREMVRAAKSV
jgi:tRNA U34 5-methylaminomethyl-2-thiouridine-forming methyltransferase MnmC